MGRRKMPRTSALLMLCTLAFLVTLGVAADEFGIHGRPWFGWWDSNVVVAGPFTLAMARVRPDGAAARGGVHVGDRIDLRRQPLASRVAIVYQLVAARSTVLTVQRGASSYSANVVGSTVWDNATFWKLLPMATRLILNAWLAFCALLIVLRRPAQRIAVLAALVLLCIVGKTLDPSFLVVPIAALSLLSLVLSATCNAFAYGLLLQICLETGAAFRWRTALAFTGGAIVLLGLVADALAALGLASCWFDPLPFIMTISPWRGYVDIGASLMVVMTAAAAKAYWLLPLPAAMLIWSLLFTAPAFITSWFANVAVIGVADIAMFVAALIMAYTLVGSAHDRIASPIRNTPSTLGRVDVN